MEFYSFSLLFTGLMLGTTAVAPITNIETKEEVLHLIGEPDFREVVLHWHYEPAAASDDSAAAAPAPCGFHVHYCEIQAWGPHRCRNKVLNNMEELSKPTVSRQGRSARSYKAHIRGLRMATTYSFEVRPIERNGRDLDDVQTVGKSIIVPTKGFSARATQCLPHVSELEVMTGPNFGGRIAVEAADGGPERCAIEGNPASAQDAYIMRISHEECGSDVNDSMVATYVIVQENLPILTHSTRRFLVLCTYKPDTLTVRAGIKLPQSPSSDGVQHYRPQSGSVEPVRETEMDYNELQPARLEAAPDDSEGVAGDITLVALLVTACFVGAALLVWKTAPRAHRDSVVSASSTGSHRFATLGRNNIDRFSDIGSVYSITLSDRDECESSVPNVANDNTSEA